MSYFGIFVIVQEKLVFCKKIIMVTSDSIKELCKRIESLRRYL